MKLYRKAPFWLAWNVWLTLLWLTCGFLLGSFGKTTPPSSVYCNYRQCVRYYPPEDREQAMLEQIIAERQYYHLTKR